MRDKNILLSIGILVAGKKKDVWKCLDSLGHLRERVPCELIITDTGCDEETHNRLAEYADILLDFEWCNDFSAARNTGIRAAHGKWFMFIDDDEWFENTAGLEKFFTGGKYKRYGSGAYKIRNYKDFEGREYLDSWITRLFKLKSDTRFESRIHEMIVPFEGPTAQIDDFVHHFGYLYRTEEEAHAHYLRNKVLLEEMIREDPGNLRWHVHLVQEYMTHGDYEPMLEASKAGLKAAHGNLKPEDRVLLGTFYGGEYLSCYARGMLQEAYDACMEGLADERNTQMCRAFLSLMAAQYCVGEENMDAAQKHMEEYEKNRIWLKENPRQEFFQSNCAFIRNYDTDSNRGIAQRINASLLLDAAKRAIGAGARIEDVAPAIKRAVELDPKLAEDAKTALKGKNNSR